ncbi:MAG: Beta-galactosidase C-terminal domain, partial [Bacteroidetes bacterium]|nr:Beta-galactosidase C-terminal domain [Bacteroidota bacterium]
KIPFTKSTSPNKVNAFGIEDVFTMFREKQIFEATEQETAAKTEHGEACGINKKVGKGMITVLGFAFGYTSDEHLHIFEKIVSLNQIKREVKVSDPNIQFVIRKGKKYSYLFLLNYHNKKSTFTVDSKRVTLNPFSSKVIKLK